MMLTISVKLFSIQILNNKYYNKKLESLTVKTFYSDSSPRGRIYDRNGVVIVDNKSRKVISYKKDSSITTEREISLAYLLSTYIDVDYSKLTDNMLREFWVLNNKSKSLKKITDDEWKALKLRKLTQSDINKLKIKRVTDEELSMYNDEDREACYIYNLMNRGYYYTEKIIKNVDVTDLEYANVAVNLDKLPGFSVKLDWERYYPYDNVFRSILGTVSNSTSGIPYNMKDYYLKEGYALNDRVGLSYIEYQYENYLKGKKAKYKLNDDGSYTEIEKGSRGNDLVLTIDIELQKEVEKILEEELIKAKSEKYTEYFDKSYVIINDPNTGEILAMAGKQIVKMDSGYSILDYTPGVFTSSVTPGSVVKGASHIVGYNTGALKIGEVRKDECMKIASTPIKCSFKTYGNIDDLQALQYSSNIYQFYTAINVGGGVYKYNAPLVIDESAFDTYRNTFASFGLGVKTGIDLPNESLGYKGTSRLSGLLLDFSIGQYDTYTPIQIAQYMSTIATGNRLQPHVLKAVFSSKNEKFKDVVYEFEPHILNTLDTEKKYLDRVKMGLKLVMSSGTGASYIDKKYNAAGKTGTAQSFIDTDKDNKIDTATTTATFSAYAPYDDPKVVFTVISPDVSLDSISYNQMSKVNNRITKRVSQKYFDIYG